MDSIIIRRPTTDEETLIGVELNFLTNRMTNLLASLSTTKYLERDPVRFGALYTLNRTLLDAEADFFGFGSWDDLAKWQKIHGGIFTYLKEES